MFRLGKLSWSISLVLNKVYTQRIEIICYTEVLKDVEPSLPDVIQ